MRAWSNITLKAPNGNKESKKELGSRFLNNGQQRCTQKLLKKGSLAKNLNSKKLTFALVNFFGWIKTIG
jgi:hypothetical protein